MPRIKKSIYIRTLFQIACSIHLAHTLRSFHPHHNHLSNIHLGVNRCKSGSWKRSWSKRLQHSKPGNVRNMTTTWRNITHNFCNKSKKPWAQMIWGASITNQYSTLWPSAGKTVRCPYHSFDKPFKQCFCRESFCHQPSFFIWSTVAVVVSAYIALPSIPVDHALHHGLRSSRPP